MTTERDKEREQLFAKWRAKFRANRERLEKLAAEGDEKARRILAEYQAETLRHWSEREPGEDDAP